MSGLLSPSCLYCCLHLTSPLWCLTLQGWTQPVHSLLTLFEGRDSFRFAPPPFATPWAV